MAKGNILKEAIADAKAVREVALANAKAALEEAFTPKLQSMLSTKLSEDLDEDMYYDEDEQDTELDEMGDMNYDEDEKGMDEEIDLEEILNELELEEGDEADDEEVVAEGDDEEDLEEIHKPHYEADEVHLVNPTSDYVHEEEEFDLDSLLKEINNLETEQVTSPTSMGRMPAKDRKSTIVPLSHKKTNKKVARTTTGKSIKQSSQRVGRAANSLNEKSNGCREKGIKLKQVQTELNETKKAFSSIKNELNEVNLLNSKLLYVNRIFKANQLDDSQKLRVVETLDKAGSTKEAKLIYETIKDTFKVANNNKVSSKNQTKTIKESFRGMASKAAGTSRTKKTAPKRAIISESDNLVNRFQKLANIKISE